MPDLQGSVRHRKAYALAAATAPTACGHNYIAAIDLVKSYDYKGDMPMPVREGSHALAPGRWVRLPQEIDALLERICADEEKSIGPLIRGLIADGLEARGYLRAPKVRRAG